VSIASRGVVSSSKVCRRSSVSPAYAHTHLVNTTIEMTITPESVNAAHECLLLQVTGVASIAAVAGAVYIKYNSVSKVSRAIASADCSLWLPLTAASSSQPGSKPPNEHARTLTQVTQTIQHHSGPVYTLQNSTTACSTAQQVCMLRLPSA
jgi:hypothetical protein